MSGNNTRIAAELAESFRYMVASREIDLIEQDFTARGEAFFHVSGAGHEASCILNSFLKPEDWLHCHYRDKALMIARGIGIEMFFLSTFNKDDSHSRGRQMNAHMSAPDLNVLSLVGPVGNNALQSAGVALAVKDQEAKPIVLCGLGDGTSQQGEVYEAIAHAVRDTLPVLFFVQDNAFAISTKTKGRTFYDTPDGIADSFYGIPIAYIDGRKPEEVYTSLEGVVTEMRETRRPRIVVFRVDRLSNHTNADDQRMYRTEEEIAAVQSTGDPLVRLRSYLIDHGISADELDKTVEEVRQEVTEAAHRAQRAPDPEPVLTAWKELPAELEDPDKEYRGGETNNGNAPLVMLEAIRKVLRHHLETDERVLLFGEDLEDPKGDVFGVTKGLTQSFPGRVTNSPLAEASIVGLSVGQALAGKRPVAFLQFADFLPIAFNQIWAELGSMWWRSDGGWQAPVIVMITCGGYKPGLGPFHASSLEALAAHTPGIDVFMPSTAGDAAGLLNAAFASERPTLFFYPKSCLNDRENATSPDVERQLVPIGRSRFVRQGSQVTFVAYGNTVNLCVKAADALSSAGISSDVIDLRSIVPWDIDTVVASAEKTGRLVVVHEDNHTAGVGAEIVATVAERSRRRVECRRVTRPDTFVPCNFANQLEVLPSYKRTLETAVEMLGGSIHWKKDAEAGKNVYFVEAIGSSPSDESITVTEWHTKVGESIESGSVVADLEADKAAVELRSPVGGLVEEVLVAEGNLVKVGTPLLKVKTGESQEVSLKQITREQPGTPLISGLESVTVASAADHKQAPKVARRGSGAVTVGLVGVTGAKGSRIVSNEEISSMCPDWSPDDIVKRTGIESRPWLAQGETGVTLAADASRRLFEQTGVGIEDIDAIICATETPILHTPAMATLIQHVLRDGNDDIRCQAHDVNAACTGYLYALQTAYDFIQSRPEAKVLVVTTEELSKHLDTADPSTAPIFADAATATLVVAEGGDLAPQAQLFRPVLGAVGEDGTVLRVPADPKDPIYMDGPPVFVEAVKDMIAGLREACDEAQIAVDALSLIIPHQANQRIINGVRQRMKAPAQKMFSNIRFNGNTSSSTIPLGLEEIWKKRSEGDYLGLTAFGGGFTYGGAVLRMR